MRTARFDARRPMLVWRDGYCARGFQASYVVVRAIGQELRVAGDRERIQPPWRCCRNTMSDVRYVMIIRFITIRSLLRLMIIDERYYCLTSDSVSLMRLQR